MKVAWSNFRNYSIVGDFEYAVVDGTITKSLFDFRGRAGSTKDTFNIFRHKVDFKWRESETAKRLKNDVDIDCLAFAHKARLNLETAITEPESERLDNV